MSGILLDTNALLWLVAEPERLGPRALDTLSDPATELFVSAASAWEVAIKTRLGRLDGSLLLSSWSETLRAIAATDLPISAADASAAGLLTWDHRDPFDRMLVAQASLRGLTIATSDRVVQSGTLTAIVDTHA